MLYTIFSKCFLVARKEGKGKGREGGRKGRKEGGREEGKERKREREKERKELTLANFTEYISTFSNFMYLFLEKGKI